MSRFESIGMIVSSVFNDFHVIGVIGPIRKRINIGDITRDFLVGILNHRDIPCPKCKNCIWGRGI